MNRLVIIGNGFDLTHGLKTTYNDFFTWLWHSQIEKSNYRSNFNLDECKTNCVITNDIYSIEFKSNDRIYKSNDIKSLYLDNINPWESLFEDDRKNPINVRYKSDNIFFSELLKYKHTKNQWADIEKLFFNLLVKETDKSNSDIQVLNKDFEQIKNKFEEYLLTINPLNSKCKSSIHKAIYYKDERLINKGYGDESAKLLILNFNYTNTSNIYIGRPDSLEDSSSLNFNNEILNIDIETNHIHGELNNIDNPIIFGYGDERGDEYKKIELLDNNSFFDHIKSFAYLNTPNYSELINFLNDEYFDTVIIGHSCGLTDRTLLNTIFEHNNCKKITPLYYKSKSRDNYQEIVRNISRCFNDKAKMRSLITDKYNSTFI